MLKRLLILIVIFATCAALLLPTVGAVKPTVVKEAYTHSLISADGVFMCVVFSITHSKLLPSPTLDIVIGPLYEKYHYSPVEFVDWHWSWSRVSFTTRINLSDYYYHWNPRNQTYHLDGVSLLEVTWQVSSPKEAYLADHDFIRVERHGTASAKLGETAFQADFATVVEFKYR